MKKKMLVLALAGIMAVSTLTGCKSVKTVDSEEVLMTVNGEEVKAGLANFHARYTQAQYETYYGSYMGTDMWTSEAEEGVTYEEYVKDTALETVQIMVLSEQHMADYGVELTEKDQEAIAKAVKEFSGENTQDNKEKVSGDDATVERYMTLQAISSKMQAAIADTVDKNVSDEDAAQKKMEYVFFPYQTTDEEGNAVELTDDEKEALKKDAEGFVRAVADGTDFAKAAEDAKQTVEETTFDAESTVINPEAILAADGLEKDEVSEVIDTSEGLYVVKVVSMLDREATDAKKEEVLAERQSAEYVAVCEKWMEEAEIEVNEDVWANVDFKELTISIVQEETEAYADEVVTDDVAE